MRATGDEPRLYELPASRFSIAEALFRETWFDAAFIGAVFEGRQSGRIFVDSVEQPTAALMARTFEYYVAGTTQAEALRAFIREAPAEAGIFAQLYGYAPTNVEWSLAILADHAGQLVVVPRRGFLWHADDSAGSALVPWHESTPDVTVREIDETLALRLEREIHEDVALFWSSRNEFLSKSFGYCTLVGDALASIAYANGIGSGEANIGVFTVPEFRRMGHAARACTAYIDRCLKLGLMPAWDSDSDNPRSSDLARKLGFIEVPPFSQLSPRPGTKITESNGLWSVEQTTDGINVWTRRPG
jgi:RimJ/RimL family protein N-acetyltransferase